jgi:hypothetical protein
MPCYGRFVEEGADTRQKRSRHLGVGGDAQASIDGGEKDLLLFECFAVESASAEMHAQVTL